MKPIGKAIQAPCLGKISKRHFTIIEMMIVITVLALVGGVIAVNVRKAFQEQRFRTETTLVVETLRLAQDLMLILQDDAHVIFTQNEKGITFWLKTESPLAKNWEEVIKRTHKTLKAIHSVKFLDQLEGPTKMGELDIKFLSGGTVMSRGVIRLSSTDNDTEVNALRSAIPLYGYPRPIESFPEERWGDVYLKDQDSAYDDKITDLTVSAIQSPESQEEQQDEETE